MKLLIGILLLSFSSGILANECDVIAKMEKSNAVKVTVDGGKLVAKFGSLSSNTTSISVISSPAEDYKPFFRGDFTYSVKKINQRNYCFLKRKGPVANSMAMIEIDGTSRIYLGLGSMGILTEAIEYDDFVTFEY